VASRRAIVIAPLAVILLAGCQAGPAAIEDGTYRAFAAAPEIGVVPEVMLAVNGSTLTISEGDVIASVESRAGEAEYLVCPPDGTGVPAPMDGPLSLGPVTLAEPAVFGDCGSVTPTRVTIVDLASVDDAAGPVPFTRWVEFCDTSDPDC